MNKETLKQNAHIFACPICGSSMKTVKNKSLVCTQNHCYDISKFGYINFLSRSAANDYGKEMLTARKNIMQSGFFTPLLDKISRIIPPHTQYVLDAGCGEGTHLRKLTSNLKASTGIGVDISKAGIALASKEYSGLMWLVADLAKLPFSGSQFGCILNILSPANYGEFQRLLSPEGVIIKVVPGKNYLKELRQIFYKDQEKEVYSNAHVTELFAEHFKDYLPVPVSYKFSLASPRQLLDIAHMSPLSWNASEQDIDALLNLNLAEVTLDFLILRGAKKQ